MQKTRRVIASLLALALTLTLLPPLSARAGDTADAPVLAISSVTGEKGSEVAVEVTVSGGTVSGGGLDIRYDPSVLTLKSAEAGSLQDMLVLVNGKYSTDTVRVSLAGTGDLTGESLLLTLRFTVSTGAQPGTYPVSLHNVRLYQMSGDTPVTVTPQMRDGAVTVPCVNLRVETVEAAAMQSVKVRIFLDEGLYPAGGNFVVTYDAAHLTAGTVAGGSALPASSLLLGNADPEKGEIAVTWAGTEAAQTGVLCTLTFSVSADAAGTLPIAIQSAAVYDEVVAAMDLSLTGGAVKLVTASKESPKLWVVGGARDDDGTATVGVVLQGRGRICGGEFTLGYDPAKCTLLSCEIPAALEGAAVVNSPLESSGTAGTVKLAWAGATPSVSSQLLLVLRFQVTDSSALTLSGVKTLDETGTLLADVELRPGAIRTDGEAVQLPVLNAKTTQTASQTTVSATVDIANALQFTAQEAQSIRVFISLYENGQMKTVEVDPRSVTFDENGIASVAVETACQGTATLVKVFLLREDTGGPCGECASAKLTR